MKVEFHTGIVTDDVHRSNGSVVPDGALELRVQSYAGQGRDGWGEHKLRWIKPLFTRYFEVPKVDQRVTVLVYESGEIRWMPWVPETDIPSWMQGNYPARSGIKSRSGSLQFAFDETDGFLHLGEATAPDPITLWPGLKTYINAQIKAVFDSHTHTVPMLNAGPPYGVPVVTVPPETPGSGTGGPSATIGAAVSQGESTKVKGV